MILLPAEQLCKQVAEPFDDALEEVELLFLFFGFLRRFCRVGRARHILHMGAAARAVAVVVRRGMAEGGNDRIIETVAAIPCSVQVAGTITVFMLWTFAFFGRVFSIVSPQPSRVQVYRIVPVVLQLASLVT